jgi:hypothetical protein
MTVPDTKRISDWKRFFTFKWRGPKIDNTSVQAHVIKIEKSLNGLCENNKNISLKKQIEKAAVWWCTWL